MDLWRILEPYVESGEENDKVELKQTVSLGTRAERAEFARDIAAVANSPGGDGYLVSGVVDARKWSESTQPVVGFWPDDPDEFRRQISQCLNTFCDPPLAEIAAVVLAELHGRMGYFPTLIRRRRVRQAPSEYELAEVIDLQAVRDQSRSLR